MTTIKPKLPYHKDPRRPVETTDVDWPWIQELEGKQQLRGYVPPVGASGVTVASGVDLGQITDPDYLSKLGLNVALTNKLLPYIAKKRETAENYLLHHPLYLTKAEADELDARTFRAMINYTARQYCSSSVVPADGIKDWLDLPFEVRSVCASLAWNCGCNLRVAAPKCWDFILWNDWKNLQRELNNFYPPGYKVAGLINRRKAEAEKLRKVTKGNFTEPPLPRDGSRNGAYAPITPPSTNRYAG